jgi:hypothetical protein
MNRSEAGKLGAIKTNALWRTRYDSNPKHCFHCGSILPYEKRKNKFCNQSCAAKTNGVLFPKRKSQAPKKQTIRKSGEVGYDIIFSCLSCGKDILDKNYKDRKFCDSKCHSNYRWHKMKELIESGIIVYHRNYKRYLLETRGIKCEICDTTEWQGQSVPLVMDHVDGNSDNWDLNNLRLVCGNCDMQLPTYKSKNKGSGRHFRRERYKEGKSF